MSQYYGIKNNSNYVIKDDGTLWEIGRNRRFNTTVFSPMNVTLALGLSGDQVKTATTSSAYIKADGTLWTWGSNANGQLGLNDLTNRSSPTQVGTLSNWSKIALSASGSTVAIKTDGTLWSWGLNIYGQLGLSDTVNRSSPVQVGTGTTWSTISIFPTGLHVVARQTNGTLWAWGYNGYGQLGLSDTTDRYVPTAVGAGQWTIASAGQYHTLGIRTTGALFSCGYNYNGELGLTDQTNRSSPTQVGALTNWSSVSCGKNYSTAIKTDGTLWSWGYNGYYNLGTSDAMVRYSPVQVGIGEKWKQISAGNSFIVALNTYGELWGCGYNSRGQLGLGDTATRSNLTKVGASSDWGQISCGYMSTYAIKTDGTLWNTGGNTWASDIGNQLAYNTTSYRSDSNQIGSSTTWKSFPTGAQNVAWGAAIDTSQTLYTFGDNSGYVLNYYAAFPYNTTFANYVVGDGITITTPIPLATNVSQVSMGDTFGVYVKTDGTLWGWGATSYGQLTTIVENTPEQTLAMGAKFSTYNAGGAESFAINTNGTLWGWGGNGSGELGSGDTIGNKFSPIKIGALSNWSKVAVSTGPASPSTLAIKTDGTLWAWGYNSSYSLLGTSDMTNRYSPTQIGALTNWSKISVGFGHTASIKTNATLWTWGYNFWGQLGIGVSDNSNRSSPTQVGALTNWAEVVCGRISTYAINSNGNLFAWGGNNLGQLGLSDTVDRYSPVQVTNNPNWAKISSSQFSVAGIRTQGTLWTWGYNVYGQLGLSDTVNRYSPVQVGTDTNWSQVSCGYHTLAVKTDGTLWAWGYNAYGQLGLSDLTNRSSPVQVGVATNWSSVSCGYHSIASKTDGTLWTWGYNNYGQLGRKSATKYSPIQLSSTSDWSKVAAGLAYYLAIKTDGTLWTQGNNSYGQLGLSDQTHRSSITQVGALSNWSQVACGDYFSAAIKSDGTLWAWGNNSYGQLGQNDYTHRSSPVQVGAINTYYKVFAMPNTILAEMS